MDQIRQVLRGERGDGDETCPTVVPAVLIISDVILGKFWFLFQLTSIL